MYELIQAGENTFYIDCPTKLGVFRTSQGAYLIDSGNSKDAGKRARQMLDANGWPLLGILNTHSHADHIGGNRFLQDRTGCRIFAHGIEGAFTEHPILEPAFLCGGCPCRDLRHKLLLAQESRVSPFTDPGFPSQIEVIPLPGHSFDMVGFRTPDNVVFLADCVASQATLSKYAVSFLYDVDAYLNTLDYVEAMEAALFVPSHAEAAGDIRELVRYNRAKVHEVAARLLEICREPLPFEQILSQLFQFCGLTMSFEQYALVGSTVRSYLAWLRDSGRMEVGIRENLLLWRSV